MRVFLLFLCSLSVVSAAELASFYNVASKYKTDKVNYHHYANMYDLYLPPLRHHAIKFLEIGLGCKLGGNESDLPSFHTWREYFVHPEAQIWEAEYNAECVENYKDILKDRILVGDQANVTVLEGWIAQTNARSDNFDVIVDDGGHTFQQQMTSLLQLWRVLKPGGRYFLEDMQIARDPYFANKAPQEYDGLKFIDEFVGGAVQQMITDGPGGNPGGAAGLYAKLPGLQSIHVFRESTVFTKCPEDGKNGPCP